MRGVRVYIRVGLLKKNMMADSYCVKRLPFYRPLISLFSIHTSSAYWVWCFGVVEVFVRCRRPRVILLCVFV